MRNRNMRDDVTTGLCIATRVLVLRLLKGRYRPPTEASRGRLRVRITICCHLHSLPTNLETCQSDTMMDIRSDFSDGWEFRRYENGGFEAVALPHDAMIGEGRRPDARSGYDMAFFLGGIYRYRKRFQTPSASHHETLSILFHGISHRSRILVNGNEAGGRTNGFVAFEVPIERFVKTGQENLIEVIVDASQMPLARYYTGAGLYRHIELVTRSKISLEYDGIRLNTTSVTDGTANIAVEVHLRNPEGQKANVSLALAYNGKKAALWESTTTSTKATGIFQIYNAHLWSAESPSLYDCAVAVNQDQTQFRAGFRTMELTAKGFYINGVETLLRGACIHQEHGVIGAAQFRDAEKRRISIMKRNGFNAIRVSHNPASKVLLEVCDEVGMYVMDELADSWYNSKASGDNSATFLEDWRVDLDDMQANNRLHASVIINSLCNEPTEPSTRYGVNLAKEVIARAKANDPTRPVTMGVNLMIATLAWPTNFKDDGVTPPKPSAIAIDSAIVNVLLNNLGLLLKWIPWFSRADTATKPIYDALDIAGYNYGIVRYEKDAALHPDRIIVGTETIADDLPFIWEKVTRIPNLIGDFMWTGWEYIGECGIGTHEYGLPWYHLGRFHKPYPQLLAGCGALDLIGNPTPTMHLAQAVWGWVEEPVITVRPIDKMNLSSRGTSWRRSDGISSWSWKGMYGRPAYIEVISPHDEIEVIQNGRSLGRKSGGYSRNFTTSFTSSYDAGTISAIAYSKGKMVARSSLKAAGEIKLKAHTEIKEPLLADGQSLSYVDIELSDAEGVVEMLDDDTLIVEVEGPASLLGLGSAATATEEVFDDNIHTTHHGRALAVIRSGKVTGKVEVTVRSKRHGSAVVQLDQVIAM